MYIQVIACSKGNNVAQFLKPITNEIKTLGKGVGIIKIMILSFYSYFDIKLTIYYLKCVNRYSLFYYLFENDCYSHLAIVHCTVEFFILRLIKVD